ncbi:toll/interleukin-1 receptor domain-containing protein [Streptomyces uncialis]|uniref:toll/interleukin-1 receptor domain-containing protein n=1 Tax=Streptomyces uncialis TaxID=1048205 RepID=UPI0022583150|nr:toll/interleukin-1 receptor domain-containing protein [Streptomyces uncialis]MCX4663534.1 toll/interleukin-1 receptor domain-containing protein [Streptomyces uncialis]
MDTTGLFLSAVGAVAGVVSAYFAYVAVRHQLSRRRRRPVPSIAPPEPVPSAEGGPRYDVFVSYGREDADWVGAFAARLRETGLNVAYDEVVSRPGEIRVHTVEAAIREAAHGLLVFSAASMSSGWVRQEYAALMQSSIESGRLFIPVVVGDVELPEFAATRYFADFRGLDDRSGRDGVYERRVDEIARALHGR